MAGFASAFAYSSVQRLALRASTRRSPIVKPASSFRPSHLRRALVGAALFATGYAAATVLSFATSINFGLVQALDSVGKNLFGSQVFSARALPPNPVFPAGAVQLDVAGDTRIGASVGVFLPPNPVTPNACTRIAAIDIVPPSLGTEGPTSYRLRYDPSRLVAEAVAIPTDPLNVARCTGAASLN